MIYLDCAATSLQKPRSVYTAADYAMKNMASPGRGCHKPAMKAADCVLDCRLLLSSFFNVSDPEKVVFTFNATHGLNIAIHSLIKEGDRVVVSPFEHNSVIRPLAAIGAKLDVADSPLFCPEKTISAFRERLPGANCAVCTHVSNAFGYILPIAEIARLCHEFKVPLIIDASQSAGVLPLDFTALNADFIAMPGHKGLLGPQGTGVLLCKYPPEPILFGGTGSSSTDTAMPRHLPDRLEAGTHNVTGIAGLMAGVTYLQGRQAGTVAAHERSLCKRLAMELSTVSDIEIFYTNNDALQGGVLSIVSKKIDSDSLAEKLGSAGICVRAGLHCAPMAHETAGTLDTGTVRFSFSPFNKQEEIDLTARILKKTLNN